MTLLVSVKPFRVASAFALGLFLLSARGPAATDLSTGLALAPTTLDALAQQQELWIQWTTERDARKAAAIVDDLLASATRLGLERLPDLSRGAVAQATERAAAGDLDLAKSALVAAERLDPGRPEASFARASISRLEGHTGAAVKAYFVGLGRSLRARFERGLWLESLGLWALAVALFAGGLFWLAQMAAKGGALVRDLSSALARRLPAALAMPLAIVLLVWPLAVPGGWIWLLLYWSILLWGYASTSERLVFVSIWALLAVAPWALSAQRRRVEIALSPPSLALVGLERSELYGGLFADLGVLQKLLPECLAVDQLLADLYRHIGERDSARVLYRRVLEKEPNNATVLLDLGAYHFQNGDYAAAIDHFKKANVADPKSAAIYFNLSQAFIEDYKYQESDAARQLAREIDLERYNIWVRQGKRVVVADGGFQRIPEIRRELAEVWKSREEGGRQGLIQQASAPAAILVVLLLALGLDALRRRSGRSGYSEPPLDLKLGSGRAARWSRVLLPGVPSAEIGEGWRSFGALLVPAALLALPFVSVLGYRVPWSYDAGNGVTWILALSGLIVYVAIRYRWDLANEI